MVENPEHRGLVGFSYPFVKNLEKSEYPWVSGCGGLAEFGKIRKWLASPYVRFLDIVNIKQESIKIEAINYRLSEKSPYELTDSLEKEKIMKETSKQQRTFEGIFLEPNQHMLFPMEFGFDTKPPQAGISRLGLKDIKPQSYIGKSIYIYKPTSDWEPELYGPQSDYDEVEALEKTTDIISLSSDFYNEAVDLEELFQKIPDKLILGKFMEIDSIVID
jgi:hypothetical protein